MNLDKIFEELLTSDEPEDLEAELESEANTTANVPGYQTPYAFSDDESDKSRKKKDLAKFGYDIVGEGLESADIAKVRTVIRQEVARIFFDLFRKRSVWGN